MPSVKEVFGAFEGLKVAIIGDVMIDKYIYGKVDRISPEAPVPVVHAERREMRLGGAANVALNVAALGAEPLLCSIVGDDAEGQNFTQLLQKRGMTDKGIIKSQQRITTLKERVLSGSQHMLRVDTESRHPLNELEQRTFHHLLERVLPEADVIIFEDYDKGTITPPTIEAVMTIARQQGIPVVVDPKKENFMAYKGVTLFKPNLKELKEGLKIELNTSDKEAVERAVEQLREALNAEQVLLTLSDKGMYYRTAELALWREAHLRMISDVSGAGDTVISIAALGLAAGLPPETLSALANLGGGLVCEYIGVVPVPTERLKEEAVKHAILTA
jgi:rfaE bifunctional protein kinase chain/domain